MPLERYNEVTTATKILDASLRKRKSKLDNFERSNYLARFDEQVRRIEFVKSTASDVESNGDPNYKGLLPFLLLLLLLLLLFSLEN